MGLEAALKKLQVSVQKHCKSMEIPILYRTYKESYPIDYKDLFQKIRKILQPNQPPEPFQNVGQKDRIYVFDFIFFWLKTSNNLYFCPNCTWKFQTRSAFQQHLRKSHLYPKRKLVKTKCPFCDKEFGDINSHITVQHTKEKYYKCEFCTKEFHDKKRFEHHINLKHTQSLKYPCHICKKQDLYSPASRACHIRRIHKNKDKFHACPYCTKKSKNKSFLNDHITIEHDVNLKNRTKIKCDLCDKEYDHPLKLKRHIKCKHVSKPREYPCTFCPKVSKSSNVHQNHMRTHTGETPYKCKLCEKQFKTDTNLNQHFRTHLDDKPFVCEVCDVSFKFRPRLRNHEKTLSHKAKLKSVR